MSEIFKKSKPYHLFTLTTDWIFPTLFPFETHLLENEPKKVFILPLKKLIAYSTEK